jgi:hypothetical protein
MFIVCQFPLADARPFLPSDQTDRLLLPDWPGAIEGKDFLRSIGGVKPRIRKAEVWPGEDRFCDAARAMSFPVPLGTRRLGQETGDSTLVCQFKRVFSNGRGVVRFEIGFSRRLPNAKQRHSESRYFRLPRKPLDSKGCLQMVLGCLSTLVAIPAIDGPSISSDLLRSDKALANYLLYCTTKTKHASDFKLQPWWLAPGRPLVMVEYPKPEVTDLPPNMKRVKAVQDADVDLHHMALWRHGRLITVWFLGIPDWTEIDDLRRLRIHLFRLHAERECLALVLRNIVLNRIQIKRSTDETERLQKYLNQVFNTFFASKRYGLDQSDILKVAYQFDDLISSGERPALQERLAEIRGNITRKVAEGTTPLPQADDPRLIAIIDKAFFGKGVEYMDKSINIRKVGGSITGNIGIDSPINNSFNRIQNSAVDDDLKNKLAQLTAGVAELCKQLPEEQAKAAARDLQTFTEEATAEAPRRSILEVIGNSLSKTAETVQQVGGPVISLVSAIVALF